MSSGVDGKEKTRVGALLVGSDYLSSCGCGMEELFKGVSKMIVVVAVEGGSQWVPNVFLSVIPIIHT